MILVMLLCVLGPCGSLEAEGQDEACLAASEWSLRSVADTHGCLLHERWIGLCISKSTFPILLWSHSKMLLGLVGVMPWHVRSWSGRQHCGLQAISSLMMVPITVQQGSKHSRFLARLRKCKRLSDNQEIEKLTEQHFMLKYNLKGKWSYKTHNFALGETEEGIIQRNRNTCHNGGRCLLWGRWLVSLHTI